MKIKSSTAKLGLRPLAEKKFAMSSLKMIAFSTLRAQNQGPTRSGIDKLMIDIDSCRLRQLTKDIFVFIMLSSVLCFVNNHFRLLTGY